MPPIPSSARTIQKNQVRIAKGPPLASEQSSQEKITRSSQQIYVVKPGDSLWAISVVHGIEMVDLANWNHITDPDRLFVGEQLRLSPPPKQNTRSSASSGSVPLESPAQITADASSAEITKETESPAEQEALGPITISGATPTPLPTKVAKNFAETYSEENVPKFQDDYPFPLGQTSQSTPQPSASPKNRDTDTQEQTEADPQAALNLKPKSKKINSAVQQENEKDPTPQKISNKEQQKNKAFIQTSTAPKNWLWPVSGRIISRFGDSGQHKNTGIDIAVPLGTEVKAAADGVVAYADNGLPGYGNLILLRHGGSFMTAYAHNAKILVSMGQSVRRGEKIATSGQSGHTTTPKLHFELRYKIQPVNPLRYLPKK
ncbi:MAG: peptidoglycan DD-metalloendopeptidase family protein [Magnetococcus sp. DMHC-6]